MRLDWKKVLSFLSIFLSVAVVIVVAFSNEELTDAWKTLGELKLPWLCCVLACWAGYVLFECLGSWLYLRRQGFSLSFFRALVATLIGFFYSNITPGAAGGQPMQVHALYRSGVSVGYGSMAVTVRLMANQLMASLIGLVLLLLNRDFVYQQLGDMIWFVRVGLVINFAVVPMLLLAAFRLDWLRKAAAKLIAFGARIRLVRHPEKANAKVNESLDSFYEAFQELKKNPGQLLIQLLCSLVSLLGLFGTVVFVYYAFGLRGTPWFRILTLSSLLFISVSYTPLPGASGAQEGGFLLYFKGVFTEGTIGLGLLIWRFFTFYLFLLVGLIALLAERLTRKRKQKTGSADPV